MLVNDLLIGLIEKRHIFCLWTEQKAETISISWKIYFGRFFSEVLLTLYPYLIPDGIFQFSLGFLWNCSFYSKQIISSLKYINDARIVKLSEQLKIMSCKEFEVCIWLLGLYPHFSDIILIWKNLSLFTYCADGHTKDCSFKRE